MATKRAREVMIADCPGEDFNIDRILLTVVKTLTRKFKSQECGPQGRLLYVNAAAPPKRPAAKKTASAGRKRSATGGKKR